MGRENGEEKEEINGDQGPIRKDYKGWLRSGSAPDGLVTTQIGKKVNALNFIRPDPAGPARMESAYAG